jgi:uncharacterized protein
MLSERPRLGEAIPLLHRAAEAGDPWAQYTLATLLESGEGIRRDVRKAADLYQRAARQGDASAALNLGIMHARGSGVRQDYAAAVHLFRRAARAGNARAHYNLALYFDEGRGVRKSPRRAFEHYLRAAELGLTEAQRIAGLHEGIGTVKDFQGAISWYRKAARRGDSVAMHNLGLSYLDGDGVKASIHTAKRFLAAAADRGHRQAAALLRRLISEEMTR